MFVARRTLVLAIILGDLVGCSASNSNELDRYALTGEVTFRGEPVHNGTITLEPDSAKGNTGPASTARIEGGMYQIEPSRGIVGGAYVARLTGYGDTEKNSGPDPDFGPPLFEEYKVRLELPAESSTRSFEITPEEN
ncbi:hypothetical protein [Gimesia maris]|uniref:Carboxypeptidase regulatory-like domain-containing protein n=2 Tax=Gimesia maris TaxID=122 RepID=A0ABX5YN22_9PLAN|nr:hypothetical protein [Gimesia maris]QDU15054.1 hypothetical protein CA11_28730 [Gimesia maris]QEG17065.1 hypothetical protein GmarT_29430 [Gimesia maris]QGQ29819.1 hypothetical protein F1729_14805 [Gimesia maris]